MDLADSNIDGAGSAIIVDFDEIVGASEGQKFAEFPEFETDFNGLDLLCLKACVCDCHRHQRDM